MRSKLILGFIVCLLAVGCSGDDGEPASTNPSDEDAGAPTEEAGGSDSTASSSDGTDEPWGGVVDRSPEGVATDAQMAQMQELGVGYAKFWVSW